MNGLDIVLVKPGSQKQLYGDLSAFELTAIEPPLWASILGGYLRQCGYTVMILDAEAEQWTYQETAEKINELKPLLAVIAVSGTNPSASTMNMAGAEAIVKQLKLIAPDIKAIFHGLHPSALPERTLRESEADFVCEGEGFYTISDLVASIKSKGPTSNIPGLWYRQGTSAVSNISAPLFKNLDELGTPAWDLLPMKKYRAHNWHCFDNINRRQPYGVLYTSLGCPFKCSFCCINAIFGKPGIRFRSPKRVLEDIDLLVTNYGIRNIKIIDELFAVNEKRVLDICDLIIERQYDLNLWAYARVNTVTPKMLARMKKAGIHWVAYGFESGSKRVLDAVNKNYEVSSVDNVVKMTYEEGLYIGANFIFGLPGDDFDSMQDTLRTAMDINAEWANFYTTMAYPGSMLYEEALKNKWTLPKTWQGYSQYAYECLPLATDFLTAGEIISFRDYAFQTYFQNPRYLDKIGRLFGTETLLHIQQMNKQELRRQYTQFGVPAKLS